MFITPAFAQAATAGAGGFDQLFTTIIIPFSFVLIIFYFLVVRPQQTRAKEQEGMLDKIRRGDTVVTTGGLIGKVTNAADKAELEVEIAPNVRVRISRPMVTSVRAKGEPVKDGG